MDVLQAQTRIVEGLKDIGFNATPQTLYAPANYILGLGGKRLRPLLTLMACNLYGDWQKALPQALAVEVFHNFTLMHDDIMDEAPLRRGQPTVHHKWNVNTAILSGDAMLVKAYQLVSKCPKEALPEIMSVFNKMALELCEGQQYDIDFESRTVVSEQEYIQMIQLKTSVLLGCALQLGAIVGGASTNDQEHIYQFGLLLGTSFQIKDDLLDCFGVAEKVGKQVGGDIIANKKTLLLIHALNHAKGEDALQLQKWLASTNNPQEKVAAVKDLYEQLGTKAYAEEMAGKFYSDALAHLDKVSSGKKEPLYKFAEQLLNRDY
jgi:geranylgeranyl diphosphate synthase type II